MHANDVVRCFYPKAAEDDIVESLRHGRVQTAITQQRKKAKDCETPEELLKLAADEGYELSDEEIAGISGGGMWGDCDDYDHKRNPIQ